MGGRRSYTGRRVRPSPRATTMLPLRLDCLDVLGAAATRAAGDHTVTTSAAGAFEKEITIPNYLPSGQHQLQAIGDETLSADINVTAVPWRP